jgi:DNA-directed RNA polymerase specialized sigma24 family protein
MIACRYRAWLEAGDPADLEPEIEALLPALQAQARRLLGNGADADDAVQEACLVLLTTRQRLPSEVPLAAIVHRLAGQRALMAARARQRRWRRYLAFSEAARSSDAGSPLAVRLVMAV